MNSIRGLCLWVCIYGYAFMDMCIDCIYGYVYGRVFMDMCLWLCVWMCL